jgi:aminoglycoside phosphotransferase (APT) family kinase protein
LLLSDLAEPQRSGSERVFPRRRRYRIEDRDGRVSFTKLADDPESADELRREATVLRVLHRHLPDCPAPRLLDWDASAGVLRLEALAGEDLASGIRSAGLLDVSAAAALGRSLALLHRDGGEAARELGPARSDPVPVHRPTPTDWRTLSAGSIDVVSLVQRSPTLVSHLDRLCVPPPREALIHGDVRFDNVMLGGPSGLYLVDWESAGAGEAAWDVGLAIAWWVSAWLSTVPQVPGVPPHHLLGAAELPLASIRPALEAFWRAYRTAMDDECASLRRCLELAAVRLVHLAVDLAAEIEEIRAVSVLHVQLAENLIEDPSGVGQGLLGLALDGGHGDR